MYTETTWSKGSNMDNIPLIFVILPLYYPLYIAWKWLSVYANYLRIKKTKRFGFRIQKRFN